MRKHNGMRPQDVLIILAILAECEKSREIVRNKKNSVEEALNIDLRNLSPFANIPLTNKEMAYNLQLSESEISESLRRSEYSGLIRDVSMKSVNKQAFLDFLIYGLRYVFPTRPSGIGRGYATAHTAPPLNEKIVSDENYIWEHPEGNVRGLIIEPLYKTIPNIIKSNTFIYELLTLTDGLRTGNSRVFNLSAELIKNRILE
ncbi:hypothetical protein LAG90_11600 [Marinilongibacter aquaticus]|uniref:hypothetical protein n=1 Tax=Marinilongibacter aquaticus TaxID=2975157 RepID=UPI0021BDD493|nr:hypothetical protein [Marinilongibacter aquaticus]UBM57463.1 hypothetical protein LAG90_11600 [Marinilongibacter aquaticus]